MHNHIQTGSAVLLHFFKSSRGNETCLWPHTDKLLLANSCCFISLCPTSENTSVLQNKYMARSRVWIFRDGLRRGPVVPSGTCSYRAAAGLGASAHGGHEEVDGSAGEERARVFCAAALHGHHRGEAGPVPARCRPGLHQSAQQGELPHTWIICVEKTRMISNGASTSLFHMRS